MTNKKRLFSYLKPLRAALIVATIFALLFVISQIAQPFLLGKALDASKDNSRDYFVTYIIIALVLAIVGTISAYIFEVIVMNSSQRAIKNMRNDVYQKINNIPIKDFGRKYRGDLLLLEIRDMENIAAGLFAVFKTLIQGIFTVVVTIVMMALVNWILAVGVIILSPLSAIVARFVSRFSGKHYRKQSEIQARLSSISLETLNNIEIVQSLNHENLSLEAFKKENDVLKKEGVVANFSASWVNPTTRLVNNIIYVIIGVAGIAMLSYDADLAAVFAVMSVGRLSSFLSYTNQYTKPFNEISGVANEYESAKASLKRINEFLNSENDYDVGTENVDDISTISFRDMSFSYNSERKLIEHFSLEIIKGSKVAIVGPTGAGKTTLINLLMRFYDPLSGDICFNDKSIKNLSKASIRNNIGMVLQDTWICSGTIKDNICYFKKDATDEEIEEAAEKAHADTFINTLPDGYLTQVNNKQGLSEGQRQMIAIARVMLLNPNIIVLDEATSNVDTRSEKLITDAFDKMMQNKTSIVIAHRLSTIEQADVIVVVKDGAIIETGKHHELMNKKGFYYSLYSSQYE